MNRLAVPSATGDDGQGHYEGDYRAEQTAREIEEWKRAAR